MKKSSLTDYVKEELWVERVRETIEVWENLQGIKVPEDTRNTIEKFMRLKIKKGIKKNSLARLFLQTAVTALIYIKMKNK